MTRLIDDFRRYGAEWVLTETVAMDIPKADAKTILSLIDRRLVDVRNVRTKKDGSIHVKGFEATQAIWSAVTMQAVENGQVMVMDNVASHLSTTTKDLPEPRELPVCVPPFPLVWAEYNIPRESINWRFRLMREQLCEGMAATFETVDLYKEFEVEPVKRSLMKKLRQESEEGIEGSTAILDSLSKTSSDIRWQTRIAVYPKFAIKRGVTGPVAVLTAYFDQDGRLGQATYEDDKHMLIKAHAVSLPPGEKLDAVAVREMYYFVSPILYGFGFAHCKNVTLNNVEPDPRVQQARRRRGHPELLTYKMLVIGPTAPGRAPGKATFVEGSEDHRKAAHIVRGHFSWYGPGHPDGRDRGLLFGRLAGQFWVPGHSRGSLATGAVVKDYSVVSGGQRG